MHVASRLPAALAALALISACSAQSTTDAAHEFEDGVSVDLEKDSTTEVDTAEYQADAPYSIAVVTEGPINGWGTTLDLTIMDVLERSGQVDKPIMLSANGSVDAQISALESAIQQKPDAIMVQPLGAAALSAPVRRAMEAGIPVITCGDGLVGKPYVSYVDVDLYQVAYDSAIALAESLDGKGKVMQLHGIAGADAAVTWEQAVEDAFAQYPDIEVVGEAHADWSIPTAKDKTAAMLASNPQIDGVWSGGGEMAVGAILAFGDAGRPMPKFGLVEYSNGFLRLAMEKKLEFDAFPQQTTVIGEACAETTLAVLNGESVKKFVRLPGDGFDESEAADYYVPELNDDFIPPLLGSMKPYVDGGMKRK